MKSLETERLIIREWKISDSADHFEYAQNPDVGPNAGWKPHQNEQESRAVINMFLRSDEVLAVMLKSENKVIGSVGMHRTSPDSKLEELKQREIGYVLNPAYWGNGYIPEAVEALKEYGFNDLGLDLIWCGHFEENKRSKRVNEKCGFQYQLKKDEILERVDGRQVTTWYYNITKEDYVK